MRKNAAELQKRLKISESKFSKLKEAPLQSVNLGKEKDTALFLKNRVKQLENEKKKLKQDLGETSQKLLVTELEQQNQLKRLNREKTRLVEAKESTTKVRDDFDRQKNEFLNEIEMKDQLI